MPHPARFALRSPWLALFAVVAAATLTGGCGGAVSGPRYPRSAPIALLDGPTHLGNDRAGGQSFASGGSRGARICALVSLPEAADAWVQVVNVRNAETISNLLTVNGRAYPLPVTLERDPYGLTSVATAASPLFPVHLESGPSEICLVAGIWRGVEVDDFEVDQLALFVDGIDADRIAIRRGQSLGAPPASLPPSRPWGGQQ
jgi:hypothetical protein